METLAVPTTKRQNWRTITFSIVACLFSILLVPGGFLSLLAPWLVAAGGPESGFTPEIHRWHTAEWGAMIGILFGGSLLWALWRPRTKPLLIQFVILGVGALALLGALFDPSILLFLPLVLLVGVAYPAPRSLLRLSPHGAPSRSLLALSGVAALFLAPGAWQNLQLQLADHGSEHALHLHWIHGVILAIALVLAGLLAATKRPGWQALGFITGTACLYLGIAALSLPGYEGSWGIRGGILALLIGLGYLAATTVEMGVWQIRHPAPTLALAAIAGTLVWMGGLLALHILLPGNLELYGDTLSAYGVGPYASVFSMAFVAFGLGILGLAIGLWCGLPRSSVVRAGVILACLAGVGYSLAGLFQMAPDLDSIAPAISGDAPPTTAAIVHGVGGLGGMIFGMVAMLLLTRAFAREARWRSHSRVSLGLTLLALLLFVSGVFIDTPAAVPCCVAYSGGWVKAIAARALFGVFGVWVVLTARQLAGASEGAVSQE